MKRYNSNFSQMPLLLMGFLFSFIVAGCTLNTFERADEAEINALPTPNPELSPDHVVRIQLEALQHNDKTDKGIEAAFNFASPSNRQYTGPLPRFIKMVRAQPYSAMLNHQSAEYEPIKISGDSAIQRVKLIGADGHSVIYTFTLSKQTEAPCKGCWMTDGVSVEQVKELPQDQA